MSNRDVLLHKADLLAALHDEGKPVELAHAVKLVRELRDALAMTSSHEVIENADCTAFVPLYFVRHMDGEFSPAVPQPRRPTAVCEWHEGDDGVYDTDCGDRWEFNEGGVADNDVKFCPFCGLAVDEHQYNDLPEDE